MLHGFTANPQPSEKAQVRCISDADVDKSTWFILCVSGGGFLFPSPLPQVGVLFWDILTLTPPQEAKFGDYNAVVVEVSGEAFYTGTATFTMEEEDPLKHGFFFK